MHTLKPEMGHLLRRAGFGAGPAETSDWSTLSLPAAINALVDYESVPDDVDTKIGTPGFLGIASTGTFDPNGNLVDALQRSSVEGLRNFYRANNEEASNAQLARLAPINAPVLALYGSADYVTEAADHNRIVDAVNSAHRGSASFLQIEGMTHQLTRASSAAKGADR